MWSLYGQGYRMHRNFQMTAPKDRLSKLLQTHELWPARQKNVNNGNCYLCVTNTFSLRKHSTIRILGLLLFSGPQ